MNRTNLKDFFPYSFAFLRILSLLAVLMALWKCYEYYQRYTWAKKRATAAKTNPPFNNLLPSEIIEEIFRFLDPASLLSAAQVSRSWHEYSNRKSILLPLIERESVQSMSLKQIEEELHIVHTGHLPVKFIKPISPLQRWQWLVEDNILAKRLNRNIIDVTSSSASNLVALRSPNTNKYLARTRLKWISEGEHFITFEGSNESGFVGYKQIPKRMITMKNTGIEYEIIMDLDKAHRSDVKLHRVRVTKLLNPLYGLAMLLAAISVPILLKDLTVNLRAENSENFSQYAVHVAGVLMMLYLHGCFVYDVYKVVRRQASYRPRIWMIWTCLTILLISIYFEFARRNFVLWRNSGICWMIGTLLFVYYCYFLKIWFRRYQIGLKKIHATIAIIIILFIYAIDWSITLEYISDGRIWRTLKINAAYSFSAMLLINFEQMVIESITAVRWRWNGFALTLKEWLLGISAQILAVISFSLYAPAGFDNFMNN